jgi:hypothetical protein
MTLNEEIDEDSEERLHSAEVSILGTLCDDTSDSGKGDKKKDSSMPSSWAVWSRSMEYPWNLKSDSNQDATYGVLASSVSISRTEDGDEIPQFEIDFSGITKTQTYYDIIYKTEESLGVQNSDTREAIGYLLPNMPVTVRTHIVKPDGSEEDEDQTDSQERYKTFVVYDSNHTVIGRTVTEANKSSQLVLNPVVPDTKKQGDNIVWNPPLPYQALETLSDHPIFRDLGDDATQGIRSCLMQVETLDRRRTIPVQCSAGRSTAKFEYDQDVVDDAAEALYHVKASQVLMQDFKESQQFNKVVEIKAFWPSPLMKPGLKVWIFVMSLVSALTALYMATASIHGLGISTVGPECARREFFLVQFVMWGGLIPLLLLVVTNLHTTHTSEISAYISHIDYGPLVAGVVMIAGGFAGSQLKAEAKNATFAAYLVSLLAYAFIWQHLNKKNLRDVVGSKLVRCWLGLYVIVWLVAHMTVVGTQAGYNLTADAEIILTTTADLALFAILPICVLDALLAAETENSEGDGTIAQMANRWRARARFVASFFRFVFGVVFFVSGFPWCLGLASVFGRFKRLFIGKLGYNADKLAMNPDTAKDASNNPSKVEAQYNEQMRDTWMVRKIDEVWMINEPIKGGPKVVEDKHGTEKKVYNELNTVVVQKHSAFDVLMLPIVGLGWPGNMSLLLYYLFSVGIFEWTDLFTLDAKVVFLFAWSVGVWLYLCYVNIEIMKPSAGLMTYDLPRASFKSADKCLNKFDINIRDSDKPQETFYWMPVVFPLVFAQIAFFFYSLQADDTHELSCGEPDKVHGKFVCEAPMFWDVDGVACCTTEVPSFNPVEFAIAVIAQVLGAFTGLQIWANLLLYGDKLWFFDDGFTSRLAILFHFKLSAHDAVAGDAFEFNIDSDAFIADTKRNIIIDVTQIRNRENELISCVPKKGTAQRSQDLLRKFFNADDTDAPPSTDPISAVYNFEDPDDAANVGTMWALKSAQSYLIKPILDDKNHITHLELLLQPEPDTKNRPAYYPAVTNEAENITETATTSTGQIDRQVGLGGKNGDPRLNGQWSDAHKVHKLYLCKDMTEVEDKKNQQALVDLEQNRRNKAAELEDEQERLVVEQQNMRSNATALKAEVNTMAARYKEEMHNQKVAIKAEQQARSNAIAHLARENNMLESQLAQANKTLNNNKAQDTQGKMFMRRQLLAEYIREQKRVKTRFTMSKKPRVRLVSRFLM